MGEECGPHVFEHGEFWKDIGALERRPSPMPQILYGATPVTSRPSTNTLPAVGSRWPVIRLNSVDLPAPFGSMTAAISPSAKPGRLMAVTTCAFFARQSVELTWPTSLAIQGWPIARMAYGRGSML